MEQIIEVDINRIKTNPSQPRKEFDKDRLKELANSIKEIGLINPIQIKKNKDNNFYELICGERRLKAHKIIGKSKIKAIIKDYSSEQNEMIESLIENLHRQNLNSVERENFITKIWETGNFKTKEELAKKIGITGGALGGIINVKKLRDKLKIDKSISTRTLRDLSSLNNIGDINQIVDKIKKKEIYSNQAREITENIKNSPREVKSAFFKNKISINQLKTISKIKDEKTRKKLIDTHQKIKDIDNDIDKNFGKQGCSNPKINTQKILKIKEFIDYFRQNSLETQRLTQITIKNFMKCLSYSSLMDETQTNKLNHFFELFKQGLENDLEVLNSISEKIEVNEEKDYK
jgi:ParB family chromosome partitioning protein